MKTNRRTCRVCKKRYTPKHDTKTITQKLCSCKCAVIFYDSKYTLKGRKTSREVANMVGRRSMAEVRFDANFIEGKRSVNAHYEISMFEFEVAETRKYTPDWTIIQPCGHHIYIEYKGVLDGATRKKMKLVKKQHPSMDIRFVFQVASNKIFKGSKTTYGMWADQHGFPWADNILPKDWLR